MPKFEVTFYCREPFTGVAYIEADSIDAAKCEANIMAARGRMQVEEWEADNTRRPTYTVHKVKAAKPT